MALAIALEILGGLVVLAILSIGITYLAKNLKINKD